MVEVHKSLKGTPFVYANELHHALGVSEPLSIWMASMSFGFEDGSDFIKLTHEEDWFIKLEMAKHIALLQRTEKGKMLRQHLVLIDEQQLAGQLLNRKQMAGLIELVKVLGYFSLQEHLEREHFNFFGKPDAWWQYRAKLLGYKKDDLMQAVMALGKKYKNQRQALVVLGNKYELVRIATIDLFIALGKSTTYATNVADTARMFAEEMKANVYNDVDLSLDFKSDEEKLIIQKIKERETTLLSSF